MPTNCYWHSWIFRPSYGPATERLIMAGAEMVPNFISAPYFISPQQIWAPITLVPQKHGPQDIWSPSLYGIYVCLFVTEEILSI